MKLDKETIEMSDMIQAAFDFWFSSEEQHLRSPFPEYIRSKLKPQAIETFEKWLNNLKPAAKDEMNDEMFAERFEEVLFETASKLVITDDENITILYPFMPRVGDVVKDHHKEDGIIVDRSIQKEKDNKYLKVTLKKLDNEETWETSFALPI